MAGFFVIPPDPGGTLEMPPVTAPMTGRTLAATTTSSVSPKSSGLSNVFLPRQTQLRYEKKKKRDYNPHKQVVPTEWVRTPLHSVVVEGFFGRLMGKKQAAPTAQAPAVTPVAVTQAPEADRAKKLVNPAIGKLRVSSRHSILDPKTGQPQYQPKPIPMDAHGNMIPDADYDKVGSDLHQSGAWGKDAPAGEHGLTGEPETPQTTSSIVRDVWKQFGSNTPSSASRTPGVSSSNVGTRTPMKSLGSSGDKKMPSTPSSSQTFVRSRSRSGVSDRINPED